MGNKIAKIAADSAEHAEQRAAALATRVRELEDSNVALGLIARALCAIVTEMTDISAEELRLRVFAIRDDLRKKSAEPPTSPPCPSCGRPVAKGRSACMYCGAEHNREDIFDNVLN